jgi:hypothetical protein
MNNWSFYDSVTASIPFNLKGYNGNVAVYYGVNNDPLKVGFDSLPGLNFDINLSLGYPAMHAYIDGYEGTGYRTICGWIQIVTNTYLESHNGETAKTVTFVSVDVIPSLQELDFPFASFGNLPQLFDAPSLNLGKYAELRWTADTFLTTFPIRSKGEEVSWLLGFRWGYIESDVPDQKPVLLPLEVTDVQVWNSYLLFLREQYSSWRFKDA